MNLYHGDINEVSYDDVLAFLEARHEENLFVDYKEGLGGGLEKDLAAFANTRGGLLFIGVKEDTERRPVLPPCGIEKQERLVERIGQIDTSNIWPPVSPETKVLEIPGSDRVVVVIRVRESEMAPHWLFLKNRVYVRHVSATQNDILSHLANETELRHLFGKREKGRQFVEERSRRLHSLNKKLSRWPDESSGRLRWTIEITPTVHWPSRQETVAHLRERASGTRVFENPNFWLNPRSFSTGIYWVPEYPTPSDFTVICDVHGCSLFATTRTPNNTTSPSRFPLVAIARDALRQLHLYEIVYVQSFANAEVEVVVTVVGVNQHFLWDRYFPGHFTPVLENVIRVEHRLVPGHSVDNRGTCSFLHELAVTVADAFDERDRKAVYDSLMSGVFAKSEYPPFS